MNRSPNVLHASSRARPSFPRSTRPPRISPWPCPPPSRRCRRWTRSARW